MKTLLIVEDDVPSAQSYAEHFAEEFEVIVAKNGEEGLQIARESLPKIILLDIMLPGKLNGFDVLRALKQDSNTRHIPVIMLTNLDDQKKAAIEFGAADCFVKANTPINQVSAVIRTVLQHTELAEAQQK